MTTKRLAGCLAVVGGCLLAAWRTDPARAYVEAPHSLGTVITLSTNVVIMKVEKVSGDDVDVRLVHPLADKDIKYAVEVIQVSDPRPPPMPAQALELEPDPES